MNRSSFTATMKIASTVAWISLALGCGQTFGAAPQNPLTDTVQDPADVERVKITTDFARDCMARREVTAGGGDIGPRLIACVNARLAKEGKSWRWNAGPSDITIEKQ